MGVMYCDCDHCTIIAKIMYLHTFVSRAVKPRQLCNFEQEEVIMVKQGIGYVNNMHMMWHMHIYYFLFEHVA